MARIMCRAIWRFIPSFAAWERQLDRIRRGRCARSPQPKLNSAGVVARLGICLADNETRQVISRIRCDKRGGM